MERIGNVSMNLDYYNGVDSYSDGDIEDELLSICESGEDVLETLINDDRWPILYHLSPVRENLLEWYDFGGGSLLEIGAGCGAVTGVFCRKCDRVVAVDLSKRRSTINAARHKEFSNLELIVGNFEDIRFEERFDYVTLIGVLEYSIYYLRSEDPFYAMLQRARELLKPGGTLIIAIENKYGLKYWAGAVEDHTSTFFEGIMGYPNTDKVRTFSRKTLHSMLSDVGYEQIDFYYPHPDYKMPLAVYSEEHLPKKGDFYGGTPAYDTERFYLFQEAEAFDTLCEDGMYEDFANSFLVFAK